MLRLRHSRPYSPFPPLFPRFFVYYRHLDRRFEPGARSPLHGEILCFGLVPLHVCSILRARVLVGHCGRTLVSEKGQWMSFWSPSAWCRPAYSRTASDYDFFLLKKKSLFYNFSLIQYNESNKIIEHVNTPIPTVDNIHIQIYMYRVCVHNRQKRYIHTDIHTDRVGQSTS